MTRLVTSPPPIRPTADGVAPGGWWHETDDGRIHCDLCPRACQLRPGDRGFCFVRENRDGRMALTTYGRSTGFCIDPIEKKPLHHFHPGTSVLSFGTAGCNLGCKFCQNWSISKSRQVERLSELALPEAIAAAAVELQCRSVAFTYNDPVIWAEYAIDTARACRAAGVKTVAVTAGYITPLAREAFFGQMDAANVDLKGFSEDFYQHYTLSHLAPVLETLRWLKQETGVWLEITNLVIPGANDSLDEIGRMCDWMLAQVGDEVPVHFTAFHPDFRLRDRPPTPPETLLAAQEVARRRGLKYPYVGNVNDVAHQSTYCPSCKQLLIERDWYELGRWNLAGDRCGHCGTRIAGHFDASPGAWGRQRMPVQISQFAAAARPSPQPVEPQQPLPPVRPAAPPDTPPHAGATSMATAQPSAAPQLPPQPARPELSNEHEQTILLGAGELIAAAISQLPATIDDAFAELGRSHLVTGAFVSLKRQDRLRSCCGFLGLPVPLPSAVAHAAQETATRDGRLPSISLSELRHLQLEVWLLYGVRPVEVRGRERVDQIEVGRHGLQVILGGARGLLLPGVATDLSLSSEQFLEHVCLKAGLPPDAWLQDEMQLFTFEGYSIKGAVDAGTLERHGEQPRTLLTDDELRVLAAVCRDNIGYLARGATPSFYLPGVSDATVSGVGIALHLPGQQEPAQFASLSLRPGVPLQGTLFSLAQTAAGYLASPAWGRALPDRWQVEVTVLYDPAMHGNFVHPDLAGFDPTRRALVATEAGKNVWLFDPAATADELLKRVKRELHVATPAETALYSFQAQTTKAPCLVSNVPKPQAGPPIRPPAVAGLFYPASERELSEMLDSLLPAERPEPQRWEAALVPHAGWRFSGRIAAHVLAQVEIPETVIVIGPKHTRLGVDWAVAPHSTWSIPGQAVDSDPELARKLVEAIPGLELDAAAHLNEHAVEVELPIVARLAPQSKVVGIAVGSGNLARCRDFAQGLASVLREHLGRVLLVISSDMNHYADDAENRRRDALALEALESLDPERLLETCRRNRISMCGVLPAVIVMETLRQLGGLSRYRRVDYATTADVTGDMSRVVGYAGVLLGS